MNIAFKIPPQLSDFSAFHLLAEVGGDEVSFLIFEKHPFTLHGFYTFNFDKSLYINDLAETIESIFKSETILHKKFASKKLYYNVKEIALLPENYFVQQQKENICNLLFGEDKRKICFDENMQNADIKVVYRVPQKVLSLMNIEFGNADVKHAVAQIKNTGEANIMDCLVYHTTIRLTLYKNNKLQIVQYFDYTAPANVVFYLLNVCKQFDVAPAEIKLLLSGMIALNSALYEEIYKYFLNIYLKELPHNVLLADKLNEHPHHFYTHLTELAQCV